MMKFHIQEVLSVLCLLTPIVFGCKDPLEIVSNDTNDSALSDTTDSDSRHLDHPSDRTTDPKTGLDTHSTEPSTTDETPTDASSTDDTSSIIDTDSPSDTYTGEEEPTDIDTVLFEDTDSLDMMVLNDGGIADGGDFNDASPLEDTESDAQIDTDIEPRLVVSSPMAYWVTTESPQVPPDGDAVVVDDTQTYQTWDGFGGTFNEKGWEALSYLTDDERERALSLLFDPNIGARFVWGRLPIGANDYALDRYTLNDTPDDLEMVHFSIDRDREMLIPYIRAAMAYQPDLRIWAGAWTPPPWMKENNAYDGGSLRDEPEIYTAYALYLARYVEAYRDEEGLLLDSIHVQNEPRYEETYPSCQWTPWGFRDFIRDYLGPTFVERGIAAGIWLGDLANVQDHQYLYAVMDDTIAASFISGFGMQWYSIHFISETAAAFPELPMMQTEHICGNPPWEADIFVPDHPPNDHAYGTYSFSQILLYLNAGVTSYMAWNMVLDETGLSLDEARPWPQNSLMTVHREQGELTIHPAYYAFLHFSAFVDEGAYRIGLSHFENGIAFKNPDGSIVVVLLNTKDEMQSVTLSIQGDLFRVDLPAQGWATLDLQG